MTLSGLGLFLALASPTPEPVLVELFSSEGCSSCPPADELLRQLALSDPSAEVLEFHVDYWNSLGWRDPFSAAAFSDRQARYAQQLTQDDHLYTPEAIVDGREAFVGSDRRHLRNSLARARRASKVRIQIQVAGDGLELSAANGSPGELWVAVTEADLSTAVLHGENSGHTLHHAPVVRWFHPLGHVPAGSWTRRIRVPLDPSWNPASLRFVGAVQDPTTAAVTALGSTSASR